MSRLHWVVGIFFLVAAFVLLVIVSVSLPTFSAVDIVRTNFDTAPGSSSTSSTINQLRVSQSLLSSLKITLTMNNSHLSNSSVFGSSDGFHLLKLRSIYKYCL